MKIWKRFKDWKPEVIDTCTKKNAAYMLREYRMACGPDCKVWLGLMRDEPK